MHQTLHHLCLPLTSVVAFLEMLNSNPASPVDLG